MTFFDKSHTHIAKQLGGKFAGPERLRIAARGRDALPRVRILTGRGGTRPSRVTSISCRPINGELDRLRKRAIQYACCIGALAKRHHATDFWTGERI
jgi:hypothetical protein